MKNIKLKTMGKIVIVSLVGLMSVMGSARALAVDFSGLDVAQTYVVADTEAKDGDILVNSAAGFVRTKIPYDNAIFGVLTDKPVAVFRVAGEEGRQPIIRSGVTMVNVSANNGVIAKGDYITSSETLGVGMKATRSGYVLGVALDTGTDRIPVAVKVEYAELTTTRNANRLFELLGASFLANVKDPEKFGTIVRYIFAGLVMLGSLTFGFVTFSRAIPKGIEAIGRNPLAKTTIYFSMALNVGLVGLVGLLGIIGSLLILRL